jgi:ribosome biogenesis GTPase A
LGKTGVGKSTIINLLAGKELFTETKDDQTRIIAQDSISRITHERQSCTTKPVYYKGKNGVYYFDCPGFNDTKGDEQ